MDGILLYIIGAILCLVVVSGRRPRAVEGGGSSDRWLECITTLPLPSQQSCQYCWIMRRIPGKGGNPCKILFSLFIQLIEWYFSLQLIPPIRMLRCSTAWCISSHKVVYFGVRSFDILIRYHDADAIVCITTHQQSSFQLPMRRRSQLNDLNLLRCPLALLLLVGERRRQSQTKSNKGSLP